MSFFQKFLEHHGLQPLSDYEKNIEDKVQRLDQNAIAENTSEIRLFCYCRNSRHRLPYFLEYYRRLGINRFFFMDNNSEDGTKDYLLKHNDVHVFLAEDKFEEARCGASWIEYLVKKFGFGYWCLVADIDEFFCFAGSENKSLVDLKLFLEREGCQAFQVMLLEMYSKEAVGEAHYKEAQNPLEVCPWFDRNSHRAGPMLMDGSTGQEHRRFVGGVRSRIFNFEPCLTKFSFFKMSDGMRLHWGCHRIWGAKVSEYVGAMLHFKFFSDFDDYVKSSVKEKNHWSDSKEYFSYHDKLDRNQELCFYDAKHSERFLSTQTLVEQGIISKNFLDENVVFKGDCKLHEATSFHEVDKFFVSSFLDLKPFKYFWNLFSSYSKIHATSWVDSKMATHQCFREKAKIILVCDLVTFAHFYKKVKKKKGSDGEDEILKVWLRSYLSVIEATARLDTNTCYYLRVEDLWALKRKKISKLLPKELVDYLAKRPSFLKQSKCVESFDIKYFTGKYSEVKRLRKIFGYLKSEKVEELHWIT